MAVGQKYFDRGLYHELRREFFNRFTDFDDPEYSAEDIAYICNEPEPTYKSALVTVAGLEYVDGRGPCLVVNFEYVEVDQFLRLLASGKMVLEPDIPNAAGEYPAEAK